MEKKTKSEKTKAETKIVDVECIISTTESGKGLLLSWEGDMYITNVEFLTQLLDGKLKTKGGDTAKAVNLGLLTKEKIEKTDLFLTLKGKSLYFSPVDKTVFIVPFSTVKEVISCLVDRTHMGEFLYQ